MREVLAILLVLLAPAVAAADTGAAVYRAMGIPTGKVLSGSVLTSKVLPGEEKQTVAMVTYLTGKKDESRAVNVRLEVFHAQGGGLRSLYARDFGQENDGYVARGEVQIVDLTGDGVNEIILGYDDLDDPIVEERRGEVIVFGDEGFRVAWTGILAYDATRAARKLPVERRDRFARRVDVVETLRTRGKTLVMSKTVLAVAGARLEQPKTITETFPLERD